MVWFGLMWFARSVCWSCFVLFCADHGRKEIIINCHNSRNYLVFVYGSFPIEL